MTNSNTQRDGGGRIDVAVISSAGLRDLNEDDRILVRALRERGVVAEAMAWRGDVDWSQVRLCVLRSCWDYSEHLDEFLQWIDNTALKCRVMNAPDVMRWNVDKHYLAQLDAQGIPVVPTIYAGVGDRTPLAAIMDDAGWERVVVKPVVSAAARDTYQVDRDAVDKIEGEFDRLVSTCDMMVQPYLDRVETEGELSLMYIEGVYTHTVLKLPKPGDFRSQDDHGGSVERLDPGEQAIALGGRIVGAACRRAPAYARVDLVLDAEGHHRLIELELIEPELFLRYEPVSVDRLITAIERALSD